MTVILPKELIMEQNLTWQAILFISLIALEALCVIGWTAAKVLKAWKDAVR